MNLLDHAPVARALLNEAKAGYRWTHTPAHTGKPTHLGSLGLVYEALGLDEHWLRHDLTELAGLDDLANPENCIAEGQARTAATLNTAASFYLAQGSTVGLHAAMLSAFQPGDAVLLPRTAHRSLLSACVLGDLRPQWLLPDYLEDWGLWLPPSVEQVAASFEQNPGLKGVVITSPTYEGIAADVEGLSQLCERLGKTLIVDEAHGALFPYSKYLPLSGVQASGRVDAVVQSLHKTGGSPTQTACLHLPKFSRQEPDAVAQTLRHLHTTSPNFVLLAALDATLAYLSQPEGQSRLEEAVCLATDFKARLASTCPHLNALTGEALPAGRGLSLDSLRLYLTATPLQAAEPWLTHLEEPLKVPYEACTHLGGLYLLHWPQGEAFYNDLLERLQQLDHWLAEQAVNQAVELQGTYGEPQITLSPREAFYAPGEWVEARQAVGRVAKQTVVSCPPGIPSLLPGEVIQPHQLADLPERVWVVK